jgi:hypothetical protein
MQVDGARMPAAVTAAATALERALTAAGPVAATLLHAADSVAAAMPVVGSAAAAMPVVDSAAVDTWVAAVGAAIWVAAADTGNF